MNESLRRPYRAGSWAVLLCTLVAGCAGPPTLHPFTTDACSLFPDRSQAMGMDWCMCCVAHDLSYWRGGTPQDRKAADRTLRACVVGVSEHEGLGNLMYAGVRVAGTPYLPTPFRWGFGWDYGRFYTALTDEDRSRADAMQAQTLSRTPLACPPAASAAR